MIKKLMMTSALVLAGCSGSTNKIAMDHTLSKKQQLGSGQNQALAKTIQSHPECLALDFYLGGLSDVKGRFNIYVSNIELDTIDKKGVATRLDDDKTLADLLKQNRPKLTEDPILVSADPHATVAGLGNSKLVGGLVSGTTQKGCDSVSFQQKTDNAPVVFDKVSKESNGRGFLELKNNLTSETRLYQARSDQLTITVSVPANVTPCNSKSATMILKTTYVVNFNSAVESFILDRSFAKFLANTLTNPMSQLSQAAQDNSNPNSMTRAEVVGQTPLFYSTLLLASSEISEGHIKDLQCKKN